MTEADATPQALCVDDFISFTEACAGLPNVQPRLARESLFETWGRAVLQEAEAVRLGEIQMTSKELGELFHSVNGETKSRVSPAGAHLLIRLYDSGQLPIKGSRGPVSSALLAYSQSEPQLRERARRRALEAAEQRQRDAQYKESLAHPDRFEESQFTWKLLNDLFIAHSQMGQSVSMIIGSVEVTKGARLTFSNSGKSTDWSVSFTWKSKEGPLQTLTRDSIYEGNRRNDEDRNWGCQSKELQCNKN